MHLVYLDDGGKDSIKLLGGIIVSSEVFDALETWCGLAVLRLIPEERRATFKRFHASDLMNGTNEFKGIDEDKRYAAFMKLVQALQFLNITYVYSAVDIPELKRGPVRSASWVDMAFRMCACAMDDVLRADQLVRLNRFTADLEAGKTDLRLPERALSLMVIDEPENDADKGRIRDNFRDLREQIGRGLKPNPNGEGSFVLANRLRTPVDAVFFGSSIDSVGLQVADACNWVMWRHLRDGVSDAFYDQLMRGPIVCAKPEPEWTQYRHLFRAHDTQKSESS